MKVLANVITMLLFVIIAGCDSDGKPKASPVPLDSENSIDDSDSIPSDQDPSDNVKIYISGEISGIQALSGTIAVYDYSDTYQPSKVASKEIDSIGSFSLNGKFRSTSTITLICLESASYIEPASLSTINMFIADTFCAFKKLDGTVNTIDFNPLMNIHTELTINNLKKGLKLDEAMDSARATMDRAYGFSTDGSIDTFDISKTSASNVAQSSLLIFSISSHMLEMSRTAGNTSHTYDYSLLAFIKAASRDAQDGMLDGKGYSFGSTSVVSVGIGSYEFSGRSYTSDLAQSLVKFVVSDENTTGLGIESILGSQKDLASNTDSFFGEDIGDLNADGLDSEPPSISMGIDGSRPLNQDKLIEIFAFDNIAVSQIDVKINNDETQVFAGVSAEVMLSVNNLLNGSNQIEVTAHDVVGNSKTKYVQFVVNTDAPTVSVLTDTITVNSQYLLELQIIEKNDNVTSVSINNQAVTYDGNKSSLQLNLIEGKNQINVNVQAGSSTFDYDFNVTLDTTMPSINMIIEDDHYTYYKLSSYTPSTEVVRFNAGRATFYIPGDRTSLNGMALTYANLKTGKYPAVRFETSDLITKESNLSISYKYRQGTTVIRSSSLGEGEKDKGAYLVPMADEYLGEGWPEYDGSHYIDLEVSDEAGNTNTRSFFFITYFASARGVTTSAGADGILNENSNSLHFELIDIPEADEVIFTIGGETYTTDFSQNPFFELDVSRLSNGVNTGSLIVNIGGQNIITQEISITVDKTPPIVYSDVDSKKSTGVFTIGGLIDDDYSQVSSIEMEVKKYYTLNSNVEFYPNFETIIKTPTYNQFNGNFESNFDLEDGVYRIKTTATATNEMTGNDYSVVEVDTTPPAINARYPQFPYDVYHTEFVEVQPVLVDFDLSYDFITTYYMPQSKTTIEGIPLTVESLMANKMLFIYVVVEDITLGTSGAGTATGELDVTYSYQIGSERIFTRRSANVSSNGDVIIPITVEYFTDELINKGSYDSDDRFPIHKIDLYVTDEMGNEVRRTYGLRTVNDPNNTYDL